MVFDVNVLAVIVGSAEIVYLKTNVVAQECKPCDRLDGARTGNPERGPGAVIGKSQL